MPPLDDPVAWIEDDLEAEWLEEDELEPGEEADAAPEAPEGLPTAPPVETAPLTDVEWRTEWRAFVASLPLTDQAMLALYETQPGHFGWLLGRDAAGRLLRLRLPPATAGAWEETFLALEETVAGQEARAAGCWADARTLAAAWLERGPAFYRLVNVDLPNLRDALPVVEASLSQRRQPNPLSAVTLATAELLCARPLPYWWLVFGPAREDWEGLLATLHREDERLFKPVSPVSLRQQWNLEGRPIVQALVQT